MPEKDSVIKFGGLLTRKERWGLTWLGWCILAGLLLFAGLGFITGIYPFLAVTHRVNARVLVVEGWVAPYGIDAAVKQFRTGDYDRVFTTGGPAEGLGGYINDYCTEASVAAGRLKKAGLPAKFVQMVPSHVWDRNRTYYSAVALRNWFRDQHLQIHSFNVLTDSVHARRSWLLFEEAFGPDVKVGIISAPNPDYNARYWWKYSESVLAVFTETIAYIYAKFLFWPSL